MDAKAADAITKIIHVQFPEMIGIKPKIRIQPSTKMGGKDISSSTSYLLTFQRQVNTVGGKSLSLWVRVVANSEGKILKISTSR